MIDIKDVLGFVDDDGVMIVDLCDICELEWDGMILGVYYCLCGMLEFWVYLESKYYKFIFVEDKKYVFYCVFGWCLVFFIKIV